ncbi:hypothetical protein TWF694_006449 [Orbilia ellipsospora]|uniref:Uncharacterized protein n=1 Tax=Orbilia ellipsospora TaxID=2528407 RepID=A0AAV9XNK0_9PEZI
MSSPWDSGEEPWDTHSEENPGDNSMRRGPIHIKFSEDFDFEPTNRFEYKVEIPQHIAAECGLPLVIKPPASSLPVLESSDGLHDFYERQRKDLLYRIKDWSFEPKDHSERTWLLVTGVKCSSEIRASQEAQRSMSPASRIRRRRAARVASSEESQASQATASIQETNLGATAPPKPTTPLSFPPSFYPTVQATSSKLATFLYDRNTLWLFVFILALASGIFAGMAFFSPQNQLYATLSQTLRVYASLWCLVVPLLRDKTLPVWPAQGWLYGTVALSGALTTLSVGFAKANVQWSGLIAALSDFATLGATVLLAMGIDNIKNGAAGRGEGGHLHQP